MAKKIRNSKALYIGVVLALLVIVVLVVCLVSGAFSKKDSGPDEIDEGEEVILEDDREFNGEGLDVLEDDTSQSNNSTSASGSWDSMDQNNHNLDSNASQEDTSQEDTSQEDTSQEDNSSENVYEDEKEWDPVY